MRSPSRGQPTSAVLADDSVLIRGGIARVLQGEGVEVVGEVDDAPALLRLVGERRPDITVIDSRMPPTKTVDGLDAAMKIRAEYPHTGCCRCRPAHAPRRSRSESLTRWQPDSAGRICARGLRDHRRDQRGLPGIRATNSAPSHWPTGLSLQLDTPVFVSTIRWRNHSTPPSRKNSFIYTPGSP